MTVEKSGGGYVLNGPRGARYGTMRNVHTPHAMFLINLRGFTKSTPDVWLSDADGELRLRGAL